MQSYNHIMPQAIIKHGWATKDPENGNMSVAVLDMIRLEDYLKNNKTASQNELLTKFETNFYKDEGVSPSHLIMRRNPDRIMGNRLIYNLTEENFCTLGFNIEKNIESIMIKAIKEEKLLEVNKNDYYMWFALQECRSMRSMGEFHQEYLHLGMKKINTLEDYLNFKRNYNNFIQNKYRKLLKKFKDDQYNTEIINLSLKDEKLFLFLGQLNTLNGIELCEILCQNRNSLEESGLKLTNIQYTMLSYINISLISKNKALFLWNPYVGQKDLRIISEAIASVWNAFQFTHEPQTLIVQNDKTITSHKMADLISRNNIELILKNLNKDNEYKYFLNLFNKFEKEIKKSEL